MYVNYEKHTNKWEKVKLKFINIKFTRETENYQKEDQKVQALVGQAVMWRTILENAFPIFLVFLVGAWTDKYGRKYPMLFVLISFILQDILLIGTVLVGNLAGMWTVTVVSSLVVSLSGNQACFISSAFSHTSDHTPVDKRTVRTGITHSLIFLGITLGLAAGGILAKSGLGFTKVFVIGAGLELFCLLYLMISMKNQPQPGVTKGKTAMQMFIELFDFQHIKDAGKCIFKKREGNTRLKLGLLLFSHACVFTPMMGNIKNHIKHRLTFKKLFQECVCKRRNIFSLNRRNGRVVFVL